MGASGAGSSETTVEQVLALAMQLSPQEKARLVAELAQESGRSDGDRSTAKSANGRRPLRGLLADLKPAPSAEEIAEVQREVWAGFDRNGQ